MLKKSISNLSAQKLRMLLLVTILLIITLSIGIFVYTKGVLTTYASEVQEVSDIAALSSQNLSSLATLEQKLASNKNAVERAKSLVAESKSYAYQDQIIKDINTFATKSNVSVTGYQFNGDTATGAAAASGSGAATTQPAEDAATDQTATQSGLKTISVAMTLKSPVAYKNVMDFIHLIEQNLTKMQLTGIAFAKDTDSPNNLSVSSLTIEVYIR